VHHLFSFAPPNDPRKLLWHVISIRKCVLVQDERSGIRWTTNSSFCWYKVSFMGHRASRTLVQRMLGWEGSKPLITAGSSIPYRIGVTEWSDLDMVPLFDGRDRSRIWDKRLGSLRWSLWKPAKFFYDESHVASMRLMRSLENIYSRGRIGVSLFHSLSLQIRSFRNDLAFRLPRLWEWNGTSGTHGTAERARLFVRIKSAERESGWRAESFCRKVD